MKLEDVAKLDINSAYEQLGRADYQYIETSLYLEKIEEYRQALLKRIGELIYAGNDQSVGESPELREDQ